MAIEVTGFRRHDKNTLRGFLTLRLTMIGLEIRDLTLHQKNNKRWLSLPARQYEKDDGSTGWARTVDFCEPKRWDQFQAAALTALDEYMKHQGRAQTSTKQNDGGGIPF